MRGFAAVVRREVQELKMWLAGALAAGILPLFAPALASVKGHDPGEAKATMAAIMSLVLAAGLALVIGSGLFGRELADRRMSFYFARPISGLSLWSGKLAGATLLILLAGALVLIPAAAFGGMSVRTQLAALVRHAPLAFTVVLFLLVLTASASIVVRTRSPWIFVHGLAGAAAVGVVLAASGRLFGVGGLQDLPTPAFLAAASLFLGLLVSTLAALTRGRTDLHRAHHAMIPVLWVTFGAMSLLAASYSTWFLAANPKDLERIDQVTLAGATPWVAVTGPVGGRGETTFTFLMNTSTGRFQRLPVFSLFAPTEFSSNGLLVAWREMGLPASFQIRVTDLSGEPPRVVSTDTSAEALHFVISRDGSRLAIAHPDNPEGQGVTLSVHEVPGGRLLTSCELTATRTRGLRFVDGQRLRHVGTRRVSDQEGRYVLLVEEVDAADCEKRDVIRTEDRPYDAIVRPDASADRLLLYRFKPHQLLLLDPTQNGLTLLSEGVARDAIFLSDGRIVVAEPEDGSAQAVIFTMAGARESHIPLGRAEKVWFVDELEPGILLAAALPEKPFPNHARASGVRILLLDTRAVTARQVAMDLLPARGRGWLMHWPTDWTAGSGREASRMFLDAAGNLVRFDPLTGERRTVLELKGNRRN